MVLPATQINRLQRIQTSAASIVSWWPRHEHITSVLETLHRLPVQQRIKFKVMLFVFKCVVPLDLAPPYLAELISIKENSYNCQLRSDGCPQESKTTNSVAQLFRSVVLCSGTDYQSSSYLPFRMGYCRQLASLSQLDGCRKLITLSAQLTTLLQARNTVAQCCQLASRDVLDCGCCPTLYCLPCGAGQSAVCP